MRGVYVAEKKMTLTASKTLMLVEAASTHVLEILSCMVTNVGNDTAEQIECGLFHVTTKGSPTGTSVTPRKTEQGDQASAATVLANLTAEPTTIEADPVDRQGKSNLAGYSFIPREEEKVYVKPSGLIALRLLQAIASTELSVQIKYREIG